MCMQDWLHASRVHSMCLICMTNLTWGMTRESTRGTPESQNFFAGCISVYINCSPVPKYRWHDQVCNLQSTLYPSCQHLDLPHLGTTCMYPQLCYSSCPHKTLLKIIGKGTQTDHNFTLPMYFSSHFLQTRSMESVGLTCKFSQHIQVSHTREILYNACFLIDVRAST